MNSRIFHPIWATLQPNELRIRTNTAERDELSSLGQGTAVSSRVELSIDILHEKTKPGQENAVKKGSH